MKRLFFCGLTVATFVFLAHAAMAMIAPPGNNAAPQRVAVAFLNEAGIVGETFFVLLDGKRDTNDIDADTDTALWSRVDAFPEQKPYFVLNVFQPERDYTLIIAQYASGNEEPSFWTVLTFTTGPSVCLKKYEEAAAGKVCIVSEVTVPAHTDLEINP